MVWTASVAVAPRHSGGAVHGHGLAKDGLEFWQATDDLGPCEAVCPGSKPIYQLEGVGDGGGVELSDGVQFSFGQRGSRLGQCIVL